MKKLLMALILAGLTTVALADNNDQANSQSGASMEAQPQNAMPMSGAGMSGMMNGQQQQAPQQDSSGSQD